MDFQCPLCEAPNPEWLGVKQFSRLLSKHQPEVRKKIRAGVWPDFEKTEDGIWRVPRQSAIRYVMEANGTA